MPPVGIEPSISAGKRPKDLHLRPRGHWDRRNIYIYIYLFIYLFIYKLVSLEDNRPKQRILFLVNAKFCLFISNKIHYKLAVKNFYTFMPRLANTAYS